MIYDRTGGSAFPRDVFFPREHVTADTCAVGLDDVQDTGGRKDGTVYDITLMDWATRKMTPLTHENTPNHLWQSIAWGRDGKTLYASRLEVSFTDADIYAIDVVSGRAANLTAPQGQVLNIASSLSKDGKTLLITSNQKGGYQNVALLDIAGKKVVWVTDTKWQASSGGFSPDGKMLTYAINADGRVDTYMDVATMRSEKIPIGGGVNGFAANPSSFSPSGDRLLLSHESSVASPITYIHSVKAPLLVLQGENYSCVPKEEAEQVVALLKKDGKTVDAHYYANEGHGFEKRENQIDSIRRTVAWFDKYLKGNN